MTKEQIEAEKIKADNVFEGNFLEDQASFNKMADGRYIDHKVQSKRAAFIKGWLAAKQDSEAQKNEFCKYCGTSNNDHLPNCKGE
jgi:hypothetical protein